MGDWKSHVVSLIIIVRFCSGECCSCCVCLCLRLWQALCLDLVPELCPLLIEDVIHHEEAVRSAGAEALSTAVSQYQEQSATVLAQLTELYHQKLYVSLTHWRFGTRHEYFIKT